MADNRQYAIPAAATGRMNGHWPGSFIRQEPVRAGGSRPVQVLGQPRVNPDMDPDGLPGRIAWFCTWLRPVPQAMVNRIETLAIGMGLAQPNYALDSGFARPNLLAL